jgi:hypothetical protein
MTAPGHIAVALLAGIIIGLAVAAVARDRWGVIGTEPARAWAP